MKTRTCIVYTRSRLSTLDQGTARHFWIHFIWKPDIAHYPKMTWARLNTFWRGQVVGMRKAGKARGRLEQPLRAHQRIRACNCSNGVGFLRDHSGPSWDRPGDCSNGVGFCRDRRDCKLKYFETNTLIYSPYGPYKNLNRLNGP